MRDALMYYVITKNPSDYPGKHVVRTWLQRGRQVTAEQGPRAVVDTLEAARAALPNGGAGLFRIARHQQDDPVIVETWL